MNKLTFYKKLNMSPSEAFDYIQEMMHLNLIQRIGTLLKTNGILGNFGGGKIEQLIPFGVTINSRTNRTITISPGIAIDSSGNIIRNDSEYQMTLSSDASLHYIVLHYKTKFVSTGKERYFGTKLPSSSRGKVLQYDDFQISDETSNVSKESIILALIYVNEDGIIPNDSPSGLLTKELKVDDTTSYISTISSGFSYTFNSIYPYILVDKEYIKIDADGKIIGRGQFGTIINKHSIGSSISYSPLIDKRQENIASLNKGIPEFEQLLKNKILRLASGNYSVIKTVYGLSPNMGVITNADGEVVSAPNVTSSEINMLNDIGATLIKTLLEGKVSNISSASGDRVILFDGTTGTDIVEAGTTKAEIESLFKNFDGNKILISVSNMGVKEYYAIDIADALPYLSGTTSNIQTQINTFNTNKADKTELNVIDGDGTGGAYHVASKQIIIGIDAPNSAVFRYFIYLPLGSKIIGAQYYVDIDVGVNFYLDINTSGSSIMTIFSNCPHEAGSKDKDMDPYKWAGNEIVSNVTQSVYIRSTTGNLTEGGQVRIIFYYEYITDMDDV